MTETAIAVASDIAIARIPVVVTTEYRGVFFGWAEDVTGETIKLFDCRNVLYWPSAEGGFLGLGAEGPVEGSRIGAVAPWFEARKVTGVVGLTPEAVKAWTDAPVFRG